MNKLLRTILTLILVGAICWISFTCVGCNGSGAKGNVVNDSIIISKRDTTRSLGVYRSAWGKNEVGFIEKVRVPDTLTWKISPDGSLRERGGTDSFYIIPTFIPDNDSLGLQKKDSLGKPKFKSTNIDIEKKWVVAEIPYVDSLIKKLEKLK